MNLVVLPQLVKGMSEAVVVRWVKGPGEQISLGDPLWEVETEKAIVELESPFSGTVRMVHCQPGDVIPIGFQAAQIGAPQEPILDLHETSGSGFRESSSVVASAVETTVGTAVGTALGTAVGTVGEGIDSGSGAERLEDVIIPFPQIQREAQQEESVCLQATGTLGSCGSTGVLSPAPLSGIRSPHSYLRAAGTHTEYYRVDSPTDFCEPSSDRDSAASLNAGSISDRFFAPGNAATKNLSPGNAAPGKSASGNIAQGKTALGNAASGKPAPGKSSSGKFATDKFSQGNAASGQSVSGSAEFSNIAAENPTPILGSLYSAPESLASVADLTRCASAAAPTEIPQPLFSGELESAAQDAESNAENSASIAEKWLQMDFETSPAVEKTIPFIWSRHFFARIDKK